MSLFLALFESHDLFYEDYLRIREDVEDEWRSGKRHQSWRLVPKAKLIRLYQENGKYGRINERLLLDVWTILQECALKVIINSEVRHGDDWPFGEEPELEKRMPTKQEPEAQLSLFAPQPKIERSRALSPKEVSRLKDRTWARWFMFVSDLSNNPYVRNFGEVKGNARYSDASTSLVSLVKRAYGATTPEDQFLAVDRLLNFAHGLGNMAKWFVEGGTSTLDQIANFAPNGITAAGFR